MRLLILSLICAFVQIGLCDLNCTGSSTYTIESDILVVYVHLDSVEMEVHPKNESQDKYVRLTLLSIDITDNDDDSKKTSYTQDDMALVFDCNTTYVINETTGETNVTTEMITLATSLPNHALLDISLTLYHLPDEITNFFPVSKQFGNGSYSANFGTFDLKMVLSNWTNLYQHETFVLNSTRSYSVESSSICK